MGKTLKPLLLLQLAKIQAIDTFLSVPDIFILNDSKKVSDLIRSTTFYYHDDEQETIFNPCAQYGAIITLITAIMGQTIKSLLLCH